MDAGNPVFILDAPVKVEDGQMQDVVLQNSGKKRGASKSPMRKAHQQRQVNAAASRLAQVKME